MSNSVVLPAEWESLSSTRAPDFKVWLTVKDKVLATHKKVSTDPANVSADIAGNPGDEFKVHIYEGRTKLTKPYVFHLYLDGQWARGYVVKKDDDDLKTPQDSKKRLYTIDTKEDNGYEYPFVFGKIDTTDNASQATKSEKILSQLGTIKVVYRRIKGVKLKTVKPKKTAGESSASVGVAQVKEKQKYLVDEKQKKVGLSTGFGQARPLASAPLVGNAAAASSSVAITPAVPEPPKKRYDYTEIDGDTPFITYIFHVRSAMRLQDEILPDDPVASGSRASKRDSPDVDEDDLDEEELEAELRALEEKTARLKAKRAKSGSSKPDNKPQVTPPPPFDWQGKPPIDMGKRIYVDYDENDAGVEEKNEIKKEEMEELKRKKDVLEI